MGFFSYEQRMFVAVIGKDRVGIVHLVGKRQQTYKISPLIVAEEFRGHRGVGGMLLAHSIAYAKAAAARQIYCTVAESNRVAMQFFLKNGFVRAGSSDSHYKVGSTEVLLYKQLHSIAALTEMDRASISVLPFDEAIDGAQVRSMILRTLPEAFDGIDDTWVDSLFAGHRRRHTGDVNVKYKLMFVAKDGTGKVLGVVGATPKKGKPIKLMPLIAETQEAFDALLCELLSHLAPFGRKLYLHIHPTVQQVLSLQRHSWRVDAAMPGAYRADVVTQQWSLDMSGDVARTIRVKKTFFEHICAGRKDLEVRVAYKSIGRIQVGERIRFVTHDEGRSARIVAIRRYGTFDEMLAHERYQRIAPDCASAEETLQVLRSFYDESKERLGVVVFQLKVD